MVGQIGIGPAAKQRVILIGSVEGSDVALKEGGLRKIRLDASQHLLVYAGELVTDQLVAGIDARANVFDAVLVHGDLDPRFVFIIAPSQQVIDRNDGFERWQKVFGGYEVIKHLADHRGAAKPAADDDLIPDLIVLTDDL